MFTEATKLQIIAYKDERFQDKLTTYTVPVNPSKFSRAVKVEYDQQQEQGAQGNDPQYNKTPPEELQLEFLFDNTGVIQGSRDVTSAIQEFKNVVYRIDGSTHRPNYLKLLWGTLLFNCVVTAVKLDYNLFNPKGEPLRALVSVTFLQVTDSQRRSAEMGRNSPDLTHIRYWKDGDKLSLLSFEVYGNEAHYLKIAKYNKFVNIRNIKPNTRIILPPLISLQ